MCAPISEEQIRAWRAARLKADRNRKIQDAVIFGTAHVEKIDISFESRSYEQRFRQMVARRNRQLVTA